MEGLDRLVTQSLARHGFETSLDHRRLRWSKWFRCESGFSLLLVPSRPGLFALGAEVIAAGEMPATGGKRMLALLQIAEAEDLGMAFGRLFLPGSPERERLVGCKCFARYAVIEDASERQAAHAALQQWLESSAEAASGLGGDMPMEPAPLAAASSQALPPECDGPERAKREHPAPLPSGF